jgi:hypothetical protein
VGAGMRRRRSGVVRLEARDKRGVNARDEGDVTHSAATPRQRERARVRARACERENCGERYTKQCRL